MINNGESVGLFLALTENLIEKISNVITLEIDTGVVYVNRSVSVNDINNMSELEVQTYASELIKAMNTELLDKLLTEPTIT